jgi:hypothetical protein
MVTTHPYLESLTHHIRLWCKAADSQTPIRDLMVLANDENYVIRDLVSKNPNCPHYIKRYIAIKKYLMGL